MCYTKILTQSHVSFSGNFRFQRKHKRISGDCVHHSRLAFDRANFVLDFEIACEEGGRVCRMVELDEKNCDLILSRWFEYSGNSPVREDGVKYSELLNV